MAEDFDRASCVRRLIEAGATPEIAAAHAALVAECVMALASKADVAALVKAQKLVSDNIRKTSYFTYLRNLQFMAEMAGLAVVAALLLFILMKIW